jgi:hypothetical protein
MKFKFFTIFLLLILLSVFPLVSSVEINMKENFDQEETLIAKISGNFLDNIQFENIFFYRGHVRVPILYDVAKINNEFYIYALLSQRQDNYSLIIKNVRYYSGSKITDDNLIQNFSISNQTADFSVYPGFMVTDEDFFLKIQNLQDNSITVDVTTGTTPEESEGFFSSFFEEAEEREQTITLLSGEIKKIYFSIENFNQSTFEIIKLSTENSEYEIPVYIFGLGGGTGGEGCIPDCSEKECGDDGCGGSCGTCDFGSCINGECIIEKILEFSPSVIENTLPINENNTKIIYLYNLGQEDLEEVFLSVSENLESYVSLSTEKIEELEAGSNIEIKLFIFSEEENSIEGEIIAKANGEEDSLPVEINFLKDYEPLDEEEVYGTTTKTCSEVGGVICTAGEECDGEIIDAKDDKCCLGVCKEIKKSSTGKIIGWTIVALVVILLIWFLKTRYKGAKKPVDLLKIGSSKR